jgi:hypothetical protein
VYPSERLVLGVSLISGFFTFIPNHNLVVHNLVARYLVIANIATGEM